MPTVELHGIIDLGFSGLEKLTQFVSEIVTLSRQPDS
jgi:hypothetical protein